jgi:hypothetical protein
LLVLSSIILSGCAVRTIYITVVTSQGSAHVWLMNAPPQPPNWWYLRSIGKSWVETAVCEYVMMSWDSGSDGRWCPITKTDRRRSVERHRDREVDDSDQVVRPQA